MLYIIVSAIALVAFIVGNMIPSFALPALRAIDGRRGKEAKAEEHPYCTPKIAAAKRKIDARGVGFTSVGKGWILEFVEKGVAVDIGDMLNRKKMTLFEIEEEWYGDIVDIKSLSAAEREHLFEHRLHLYKEAAEEYARSERGLQHVLDSFLKKQECQNQAAAEVGTLSAMETHKQLARSWDEKFESAQPDKDS